jgi:ferredoxin-type protein NapH
LGFLEIACPLGVVQVMAAARRLIPALLLAGASGLLLVLFFGRAFCSWICPGRWIFNRGPVRDSKPWRARAWVQRALVGGVIGAAWLCHSPVFCVICPAGVVCRGAIAAGTGGSLLPTFGWLGTVVGLEWASGRSWCRDLCPLGAAFSRLSRLNPFLKVKADPQQCVPCKVCRIACSEDLNLATDTDLTFCTKCMDCIPVCPRQAIELKLH